MLLENKQYKLWIHITIQNGVFCHQKTIAGMCVTVLYIKITLCNVHVLGVFTYVRSVSINMQNCKFWLKCILRTFFTKKKHTNQRCFFFTFITNDNNFYLISYLFRALSDTINLKKITMDGFCCCLITIQFNFDSIWFDLICSVWLWCSILLSAFAYALYIC